MISSLMLYLVVVALVIFTIIIVINKDNGNPTFILLLFFTFLSGAIGANLLTNATKKECELNLPRNQYCVVIAIPMVKELK